MKHLCILVFFLMSFLRSTAQTIPHATLRPGVNEQYPSELRLMGDQRLVVCVQSQAVSIIDLDGDSCVYSATLTDDRMQSSPTRQGRWVSVSPSASSIVIYSPEGSLQWIAFNSWTSTTVVDTRFSKIESCEFLIDSMLIVHKGYPQDSSVRSQSIMGCW